MNPEYGKEEKGMGGSLSAPSRFRSHRSSLFFLFLFFLLSSACWDARIRSSIGQYVSARLIQVDISAEWRALVSKTLPVTHSSSLILSFLPLPPLPSHGGVRW